MTLCPLDLMDIHQLAEIVRTGHENVLVIDSRSFLEFNTCHILSAINLASSKIVKRRLQQDKMSVRELLRHACHCDVDGRSMEVVVYDQSMIELQNIPQESFLAVLLLKLASVFSKVNVLLGGFVEFRNAYPDLCEDKSRKSTLTTLSQPSISIANTGPTKILPFLYLGSQVDVLNRFIHRDHNITYVLNVSITCPKPDFIQDSHFMRIPVNDNFNESLLPHLPQAIKFLDKVRESGACALVHCLAGMSRSATVVIAYVMRHMKMSSEEAYRYVKSKRASICPNFNFLGQLLEYEKQLRFEKVLGPLDGLGAGRRSSNSQRSSRSSSSQSLTTMQLNSCITTTITTISTTSISSSAHSSHFSSSHPS